MYSVTLNFQMFLPILMRIPRHIYSILITGITIGVGVEAAKSFFLALENFIGLIGYWAAIFIGIVIVEHLVFRRGKFSEYTDDTEAWDDGKKLPPGWAAAAAALGSLGLLIPCMGQIWWTGPIAERTGDLGFEVALVVSAGLYVPFRWAERRWFGR